MVASEMTKFADDARVCLSCSTVGDPNRTGCAHFAMHARATTTPRSIATSASGRPLRRVDRVARVPGADSASLSSRARPSSRVAATSSESSDPSQWRVRQVYGDGKVLLDQLREVADLLADGFNSSGRSSRDLLNGLVQKVRARPSSVVAIEHSHPPTHPSARPAPQTPPESPTPPPPLRYSPAPQVRWSGGNFICLVADDGADGSPMVGACDVTLLPAGGEKRSREGLVADIPAQLSLPPDDHFLYLTGMVVPASMRRRGVGRALLARTEAIAPKMRPRPSCVALHVDKSNDAARGLYASVGFEAVADMRDGGGGGEGAGREDAGLMASFPLAFPSGGLLGIGRKAASRNEVLMVKRLPDVQGGGDGDVAGDGDGDGDGDGAQ